jgi:Zn-dependent protease
VNRYTRIPRLRIYGAPLFVHWSVLVIAAAILLNQRRAPWIACIAIVSYFGILLLHEAGHAWMVKRQRLRRLAVRLSAFHGVCVFEEPMYARQDYLIAWGGVMAQLLVAVPIVVLDALFDLGQFDLLAPVVAILGYASIGIAAFNLIPGAGLDGEKAWKLIPLWLEERRERTFRPSRKQRRFRLIRRNHD